MRLSELYEIVPVYPDTLRKSSTFMFPVEAPLCEDDEGGVSFLSAEAKAEWMRKIRIAERNRKYKQEHRIGEIKAKPGDLFCKEGYRGLMWFYLITIVEDELKVKVYTRTFKGKESFRMITEISKVPKDAKYMGVFCD